MNINSNFRKIINFTTLKLLVILIISSMPFGCSENDDGETIADISNNFTVFTNQTGDPNTNALQAQYIDLPNNAVMDIYGTFNLDGTPKQISNIRYKRANNDSIVNVLIDEFTGKPKMAIMEVNGQKQNIVTEFGYTDNDNEIIISFHEHDFENGTSELLYSSKFLQNEDGISENPIYLQRNTTSNSLWGVISIGGGIAVAELVSIYGGGFSLFGTALAPVIAAISSVGVGTIIVVGGVALLLSEIANAAEVAPQDIPYPNDTPSTNPINDNEIPNFPENPCINSNLSVVIGLDPCNEIVAIASGGASGPIAFYWSTGESIETNTFTSITVDTVGTYSVGIVDSAGCAAVNTITVDEIDDSSGCENEIDLSGTWIMNTENASCSSDEVGVPPTIIGFTFNTDNTTVSYSGFTSTYLLIDNQLSFDLTVTSDPYIEDCDNGNTSTYTEVNTISFSGIFENNEFSGNANFLYEIENISGDPCFFDSSCSASATLYK